MVYSIEEKLRLWLSECYLEAKEGHDKTRKTKQQLADFCGVSKQAAGQWFVTGKIAKENLMKVIEFYGKAPHFLQKTGYMTATLEDGSVLQGHSEHDLVMVARKIPLLSWVRAGDFCEAPGQFTLADAEDMLPNPIDGSGPRTFALTVRGDSMATPDGYQEGEIVYIDPDITPVIGNDILARTDAGITLKRYKEDEHGPYLLALNGNQIIRPPQPWHICGVVVFSGRRR